jgi:hypothetical protein
LLFPDQPDSLGVLELDSIAINDAFDGPVGIGMGGASDDEAEENYRNGRQCTRRRCSIDHALILDFAD